MFGTLLSAAIALAALLFCAVDLAMLTMMLVRVSSSRLETITFGIKLTFFLNIVLMASFEGCTTAAAHLTGVMLREWMVVGFGITALETGIVGVLVVPQPWRFLSPFIAGMGLFVLWEWFYQIKPIALALRK
jgi:hypothetical protein